jgi:hypothetical protein
MFGRERTCGGHVTCHYGVARHQVADEGHDRQMCRRIE